MFRSLVRVAVPAALVGHALAAKPSAAQWVDTLSAEVLDARAAQAEAAPLFSSHEPLALTLRTDISWIREKRSDVEEAEGTVSYRNEAGEEVTVPVKVRARGNFRRDRRNCNFPPLRLNFAGGETGGTVFEGQDKLKLVTPCEDGRRVYQQYILQEYLVYRVYQLLTPVGFRVRLVEITYEDPDGGYDTRTKTAFLIESDEAMARRNRAEVSEWEQFPPDLTDPEQSVLVALFQYMVGNTDFSAPYFHNVTMIRQQGNRFLVVPYDFDVTGVVDARYAIPDPRLPIRNVGERLYRGFCREGVDHDALVRRFNAQREGIRALYEEMPGLEERERTRGIEYYDKFYQIINDPRRYEREVLDDCRKVGS